MSQVAIVASKRTAVGNFAGSLASVSADELGATVIRQVLADTGLPVDQVSEVRSQVDHLKSGIYLTYVRTLYRFSVHRN